MSLGAAVYQRLPTAVQDAALTAYGYRWRRLRRGGRYPLYRREFAARDGWDAAAWCAWQDARLRAVLRTAWAAPATRERWLAHGIRERELGRIGVDGLARLPPLAKEDVRRDPAGFCPGGRPPAGSLRWPTGGSTGTPLTTFHAPDDLRRALALRDARYASFAGVSHDLARATIGGRIHRPAADARPPFHRTNSAERQLYFSAYHLGPATVEHYVEALRRHRPAWLTGYAGAIGDLARLALARGLEPPPLRAVVTLAEPVLPGMRAQVERAFGCRVTEEYGLAEEVAFALECERGSLHVSPDAGVVEILDEDGAPCAPGVVGELVATGLVRLAQPLVRYRTGDLAAWAEGACACGRAMPVLRGLEGRVDDAVVLPDGRRVRRLTAATRGLGAVLAAQFVQEAPERLRVRVVCAGALEPALERELARRVALRLGPGIRVVVEQADELERTPRGKIRSVVSRVAA